MRDNEDGGGIDARRWGKQTRTALEKRGDNDSDRRDLVWWRMWKKRQRMTRKASERK